MTGGDPKADVVSEAGPGPFVTERHYLLDGQRHIWRSRPHRRGLSLLHPVVAAAHWHPARLNVWIGSGFLIGSAFFAICSALGLYPGLADGFGLSETQINTGFFIGSIFFTTAAYTQLFQSANPRATPVEPNAGQRLDMIGWRPHDIGWLSSFLQFLGTLLFNLSTFMTLHPSGNWLRDELLIWGPDVFGSILFLSSGYLAVAETSHGYWSWRPNDVSWWSVMVSFAGCVAFMISAVYAFVPQSGAVATMVTHSIVWTLVGAVCFFISAALLLVESRSVAEQDAASV